MISKAVYPDLHDQVVLITGGGSGIGADLVRAFAEQQTKVFFLDIDDAPSQALVRELAECKYVPEYRHCDLTDISQLKANISDIEKSHGAIGVLVNNAGNDKRHTIDEASEEYWDWAQAVNIKHQFFAIQAVVPGMRKLGKGSIINFSSIAWMAGGATMSAYCTSKAAVVGLTKSTARDLGPDNIRVNAIAPGAVLTEKQRKMWFDEEKIKSLLSRQCLQRELDAKPIARMALFLASEESDMTTKQVFVVDGGIR